MMPEKVISMSSTSIASNIETSRDYYTIDTYIHMDTTTQEVTVKNQLTVDHYDKCIVLKQGTFKECYDFFEELIKDSK